MNGTKFRRWLCNLSAEDLLQEKLIASLEGVSNGKETPYALRELLKQEKESYPSVDNDNLDKITAPIIQNPMSEIRYLLSKEEDVPSNLRWLVLFIAERGVAYSSRLFKISKYKLEAYLDGIK